MDYKESPHLHAVADLSYAPATSYQHLQCYKVPSGPHNSKVSGGNYSDDVWQ